MSEVTTWATDNGVPLNLVKQEIAKTIHEPSIHAPGPGYVVAAVKRMAQRQTGKTVAEMDKIYKSEKERRANDALSAATGSGGGKPPTPPPVATGGSGGDDGGDGGNGERSARVSGEALEKREKSSTPVKGAAWKEEASRNPHKYTPDQLARMRRGQAPIGSDGFPMEIHHKTPLANGGKNAFDNYEFLTRSEHRLTPNYSKNHPNLP